MRFLSLVVPMLVVGADVARAVPLDLGDPSPRAVTVEIESSTDFAAVAQLWGPVLRGEYATDGAVGRVVVPGAELERLPLSPFPAVPGSFTDFVIEIDLVTLSAVVQPFSMTFHHTPTGADYSLLTGLLDTQAVGGFVFGSVFCATPVTPIGPCTLVPGAAYDPAAGTLNAIGSVHVPFNPEGGGSVPDLFSTHGDLRLQEVPEPGTVWLCCAGIAAAARASRRRRAGAQGRNPDPLQDESASTASERVAFTR